jgi:hypothetical protein
LTSKAVVTTENTYSYVCKIRPHTHSKALLFHLRFTHKPLSHQKIRKEGGKAVSIGKHIVPPSSINLVKIVLIVAAALVLQTNASAQAQSVQEEQENECFNLVQGKVAYDRAGNKTWAPVNIKKLCAQTTNAVQTVRCFENTIKAADDWQLGIATCSRRPGITVGKPFDGPVMPVPTPSNGPTPLPGSTPVVQFLPGNESDTAGPMEQACHKELQTTVAIHGGFNRWPAQAYRALCKGTTTAPAPAVACYKRATTVEGKSQQKAVEECAVIPPPAGRVIDFTHYDTIDNNGNEVPERVTPDELDPVEIEVNPSPLSDEDMKKVMSWLATRTAALLTPYCYKASYSLGGATTLGCAPGQEKNGQLCYPQCREGHIGNGPVCYQNCPAGSGLKDIGALCQKSAPYGRGAGYALWSKGQCEKDNPGGCELSSALYYPRCKTGYKAVGCCICSPVCPAGMTDTGTDCVKNSYGRGAGSPISGCPAGKQQIGLLCYEQCRPGYAATGPTCFQKCPVQQPVDCAAGCSVKAEDCAIATMSQVLSPILAVYSLATLGAGAGQSAVGRYAASTFRGFSATLRAGSTAGKAATRLRKVFNSIKRGIDAAMGPDDGAGVLDKAKALADRAKAAAVKLAEGQENFDKIVAGVKGVNRTRAVVFGAYRLYTVYSREYALNFADMTSPEISKEIDDRFGKTGAMEIKKRWALYNMQLVGQASGFATGQVILSVISTFDPTGITGIVSAFTHPVCGDDTPFPAVTPLYKN